MRFVLTALVVSAPLFAQSPDPDRAPGLTHSIVMFERRPYDLDQLRLAIRDDAGAEAVAAIVADLEQRAESHQRSFAAQLTASGGSVRQHFWLINGCSIAAPASLTEQIESWPGVDAVWESLLREPQTATTPALPILTSTNAQNHHVDQLQAQGILGAGTTVAYVDSSFDSNVGGAGRPHQTFFVNGDPLNLTGGGIAGSRLLVNRQMGVEPADLPFNHGTKVSAVGIGETWNAPGIGDRGHAPAAKIAGYAISDFPNGFAEVQTMVAAWQSVVADIPTFGTQVGVMAYEGTDNVMHPEQQAIDAAAWVGDLLIALSSTVSTFPGGYHAAVNALACGATDSDVHTMPSWSSVGPLADGRFYPHMVANGNGIATPDVDNETLWAFSAGTSYSCSQVGGAAALFRSVDTTATAEQTRAALLATTEDISQVAPAEQRGHGYLRDDRLVALAQGSGLTVSDTVDIFTPSRTYAFAVQKNQTYAVALSWSRQISNHANWANLDLRILQDGLELATAASTIDPNEKVVFRAKTNSPILIVVERVTLETQTTSQPFGLAAVAAPDAIVPGSVEPYGFGCPGAPGDVLASNVFPPSGPTAPPFGPGAPNDVLGTGPHRTQILLDSFGTASDGFAIAFRYDNLAASPATAQWIELEIDIGPSAVAPQNASANFAANLSPVVIPVVARRRVVLPPIPPGATPDDWQVVIPFDQAISTFPDYGFFLTMLPGIGSLLVDIRVYATSTGLPITYPVDGVLGPSVTTVYAPSPTATTGTVSAGVGPFVNIAVVYEPGMTPTLDTSGAADAGETLTLELSGTEPLSVFALMTGLSNQVWAGVALPLDLAPFGAAGCYVLAALELPIGGVTDNAGMFSVPIPIPNGTTLVGTSIYQQALVFDVLANSFGVTLSNGLEIVIGGR